MLTKKEYEVVKLRLEKRLTQAQVAKELGISQAAVSKFEKSFYQKIKQAHKIVEFSKKLGINVEDEDLI